MNWDEQPAPVSQPNHRSRFHDDTYADLMRQKDGQDRAGRVIIAVIVLIVIALVVLAIVR